ncbi:MAG: hypothetical protein K0S54_1428 [Alphaproteobacteria bacterium]|jgi:hypothetical protein|nr:hypothetical protein [Alphaproteobacteria bacterium]
MRRSLAWLLAALLFVAMPSLAPAQDIAAGDRTAIQSVIDRQIAAFRRDDGREAFSYAAPDLQAQLGSAEIFMGMVRTGYAPVYRPRSYQFRELKTIDGAITQQVHVVGPDGVARLALYFMQQQKDGSWRVSGCVLLDFEGDEA